MKSVLISIQPKWCELIASGKKTIEVRKTAPKLETPLKCYIYMTKNPEKLIEVLHKGDDIYGMEYTDETPTFIKIDKYSLVATPLYGKTQKVIGEFVCDEIMPIMSFCSEPNAIKPHELPFIGMTDKEVIDYLGNGKEGCGLHISELTIYDTPKELGEFKTIKRCKDWRYFDMCSDVCGYAENNQCHKGIITKRVTRPPQSWMYVQELNS